MPDTLSKAEFAAMLSVHPSRVSHWIADGALFGDALVGTGRAARIAVAIAKRQLEARLDVGQAHGNGAARARALRTTSEPFPDAVWRLIKDIPSSASFGAIWAGAPIQVAYMVDEDLRVDLKEAAERIFGAPLPGKFDPTDWKAWAAEAGEPVDMKAWRDWRETRNARLDEID